MYQPNQPKMVPVRPRSSLSNEPNNRVIKGNRCEKNNLVLTFAGFCIFLSLLCAFLLGTLIYVGKKIADGTEKSTIESRSINLAYAAPAEDNLLLSTTHVLRVITNPPNNLLPQVSNHKIAPEIMATSKVIQKLNFRLPRELFPSKYFLRLQPDLQNKTFSGNVRLLFEVRKPIAFIPVHAHLLNVSTQLVQRVNKDGVPLSEVTPSLTFAHHDLEYWVTEFEVPLEVGYYSISLNFNGSLTDRIVGFYQSSYFNVQSNEMRWIATSKFEPTYARQAFPCFDEPAMKAQFTITVVRPSGDGYHALSNMNVISEKEIAGGLTEVNFAKSEPMSTYLACFIVSDFASKSATVHGLLEHAKDFEMRVFSTASQVDKVEYALEAGVKIMEYYIEYFQLMYPLPKLDMAAIPDFVSGAMEHWGLVTFRETAMLYDPINSSNANKQRVATVVAHELAHMWFGNLVTMNWWNDLWLSEGFASYIEYKGVDKVHPEWKMLDQFLIADLHNVMNIDGTLASHPIVQTVESPNEITELFDSITYSKGASVIRMMEDLVGEEKCRNGTTNYLKKHYFSTAKTDDYWTAIEAQDLDIDIKRIMQTWTEQMGIPVIQVNKTANNVYTLTQKRFLSNPADYNVSHETSQFNYHWSIPLTYFTSANAEVQRAIFNYDDSEIKINLPSAVDWIKFNKNQVGYYRVNYPVEQWKVLTDAMVNNLNDFSVADRAQLLNDVFAFADATQLEYSTALELTTYLEKETDYVPWSVATSNLNAIKNKLYYTTNYPAFNFYGRQLLNRVYESVTWTVGTDHLQNLLRVTILNAACGLGHEKALEEAGARFNDWLINPAERPSADLRSTIYSYGMQEAGNEKAWQQVWELFVAEQDAQEKIKLMDALTAVKEPWILQRLINLAWNESYVRGQDYFTCLQNIAYNRVGQSLVWDHVRENWEDLVDRFTINDRKLGRLIPAITSRFNTKLKLEEMETFFAKYPDAGAGTVARKEALETVKYNIQWLTQNQAQVGDWLASQNTGDKIKSIN